MGLNEFKDLLFDIINEDDRLHIVDLTANDAESTFVLQLEEGTFLLRCSTYPSK